MKGIRWSDYQTGEDTSERVLVVVDKNFATEKEAQNFLKYIDDYDGNSN